MSSLFVETSCICLFLIMNSMWFTVAVLTSILKELGEDDHSQKC